MTAIPPLETPPAPLAAIPRLPVFLDLQGKPALVTGGGPGSAWKAELLAAAGARVTVHAADPGPELIEAAARQRLITLTAAPWTEADLAAAAIAIGGESGAEAERLAGAARRLRVPVNVIDTGQLCDFTFGAIVERSPVLVAISTDGGSPVLAQAIRRRIEAVLPLALGRWADAAGWFRAAAKRLLPDRHQRRRFWETASGAAFARVADADPDAALARLAASPPASGGEIVIVGAGPGDPELVTLAAVREMGAADVVFYDRLVPAQVLELARREARRVAVGKRGGGESVPQAEITAALIAAARAGERVVRLKGGDPAIFARTTEEAEAARAAGIPVRIVPGVTAASAAAAAAGIALTRREGARRLQFVTAHGADGPAELAGLADPASVTAVYMGRGVAGALAGAAIAGGAPPATPALLASAVGTPAQTLVATTLERLDADTAGLDPSQPALILIGEGLALNAASSAERDAA